MHLYIPIEPPPTPAPSPGPTPTNHHRLQYLASILNSCTQSELRFISVSIAPLLKRDFLRDLPIELALHVLWYVNDPCSLVRVSQVSKKWRSVVRDDSVWRRLCGLYQFPMPGGGTGCMRDYGSVNEPLKELEEFADKPMDPALEWLTLAKRRCLEKILIEPPPPFPPSSFSRFKYHYITLQNWRYGGQLLREYPAPTRSTAEGSVITSVALDSEWVVVASESAMIHVFSARTGVLHRVLVGHSSGVWSVGLVSRGGSTPRLSFPDTAQAEQKDDIPMAARRALGLDIPNRSESDLETEEVVDMPSHPSGASEGWGQPNAIVVSAGCDQVVKVWDVVSGNCIYTLSGHTATVRCLKMLHHSPTAVTGARDGTLRVWDVQRGKLLKVLQGHMDRVRCLDVYGRKAVSGSYDWTCRLWDIDTGECIHVLRGHYQQVYCVAFNGVYIASGGLDTVVRVWNAETGQILSVLTGHTTLVCQLQLSPQPRYPHSTSSTGPILATGGSDGRVITYDLESRQVLHRIAAHDAPITALQFDEHFIVSSGSDGRVRIFDTTTGRLIRDWYDGNRGGCGAGGYAYGLETGSVVGPSGCTGMRGGNGRYENVWKVVFGGSLWGGADHVSRQGRDVCAVMCRKPGGKTVMEIWKMSPDMDVVGGELR